MPPILGLNSCPVVRVMFTSVVCKELCPSVSSKLPSHGPKGSTLGVRPVRLTETRKGIEKGLQRSLIFLVRVMEKVGEVVGFPLVDYRFLFSFSLSFFSFN